jgi:hypothetical protein
MSLRTLHKMAKLRVHFFFIDLGGMKAMVLAVLEGKARTFHPPFSPYRHRRPGVMYCDARSVWSLFLDLFSHPLYGHYSVFAKTHSNAIQARFG